MNDNSSGCGWVGWFLLAVFLFALMLGLAALGVPNWLRGD